MSFAEPLPTRNFIPSSESIIRLLCKGSQFDRAHFYKARAPVGLKKSLDSFHLYPSRRHTSRQNIHNFMLDWPNEKKQYRKTKKNFDECCL